MNKNSKFKIGPIPKDDAWECMQCAMNLGRNTNATMLVIEGHYGKRGVIKTGICGNHAEAFDLEDFRKAEQKYVTMMDEEERKKQDALTRNWA